MRERRARALVGVIAGAAVLSAAVLVAAGIVVPRVVAPLAPQVPVRAYLQAIVDGRIADAVRLGRVPSGVDRTLLTADAYDAASDRVSSFSLGAVTDVAGGKAVRAEIVQGATRYTAQFRVEHVPGILPARAWRLLPQRLPSVTVRLDAPAVVPARVAGTTVAGDGGVLRLPVFPGTYEFTWGNDPQDRYFDGAVDAAARFTGSVPVAMASGLTAQSALEVQQAVVDWVTECASSAQQHPPGCPFRALAEPGASYSNGAWTVSREPTVAVGAWDAAAGGWQVTAASTGRASYSADETIGGRHGRATTGDGDFGVVGVAVETADGALSFVPSPAYDAPDGGAAAGA